jgi:hypothetical protein
MPMRSDPPKEAVMKNCAVSAFAVLGLLLPSALAAQSPETGPEAMILRARAVIMVPDASRDAITKALIDALDASLLILPETDDSKEFRSRVETVRKIFDEGRLFSDKARQYLELAYKLVSGGRAWQLPEELKTAYREKDMMERAKNACLKLVDSALAERKAGHNEAAVQRLVEFVILVITPIEA